VGIGSRALRIAAQFAVVTGAIAAASCGPGTNAPPVAVSLPVTTIPSSAGSFTAPPASALSVTFNVAAGAPAGTTATVISSVTAPSGVPAPSSIERQPQSIAGALPFLYISLELNHAVPTSMFTSWLLTLTSALPPTASYYVEIDDPSATRPKQFTILGTVSNGVVTFTNSGGSGANGFPTLAANHVYVFQFYYVVAGPSPTPSPTTTGSASPTPTPTPTPAPTPTLGPVVVTPALVPLGHVGQTATIGVSESGYSGSFTAQSANPAIASVSPASGTSFTVTAVLGGTTTITFSDTAGNQGSATVSVTTAQGAIQ